ncbi:hypothetical protein FDECE_10836 [Fusarium decemcellulare]|nr:hypothetical protein FDECE_10836 [Fusarium decemcellulare]
MNLNTLFKLLTWQGRSKLGEPCDTVLRGRLEMMNDEVGQICTFSGVPGASIGVIHNGNVVHTFNFGKSNQHADVPMTSDTVCGIGSITKSFISAAISNLVHQGKTGWDTPVKKVLPKFKQNNPFVEESLTIGDILSHRSGLAGFGDLNMAFQGDGDMMFDKSSLFDLVKNFPTHFPLRSDWSYFVWGYALAGEIIEKLSGEKLHDYIHKTLLQPLGLNATTFDPKSVDTDKLARPYAGLSDGTAFPLPKLQAFKGTFFEASGGLYSSLNDLMTWSRTMLEAIHSKHPVIKDAETIISNHAAIENPSLSERSYGYGWVRTQLPGVVGVIGDNVELLGGIRKHPPLGGSKDRRRLMLYHQGSTVGYHTFLALFPETDSAVVVLTNSIAPSDTADWIARAMIKALFDLQDDQNYANLAKQANRKAVEEYELLAREMNARRTPLPDGTLVDLGPFVGRYKSLHKPFVIDILADPSNETQLIFRFQELRDQAYRLRYLCENQLEWALTHDESKKRGRYHNANLESYIFKFEMGNGNQARSFLLPTVPYNSLLRGGLKEIQPPNEFIRVPEPYSGA